MTEMSRKLRVRDIVEGSMRRAANRLRITAQLIDAVDDANLWAKRYDRQLADIFDAQDEVGAECHLMSSDPTMIAKLQLLR